MKRFLLVDDDMISNFLMIKTLERIGVVQEIDSVLNGKEALRLLNDYYQTDHVLPDVVLLDINMPVMNGFQFLEEIRKLDFLKDKNIRIIVVSSSDDSTDIEKAKTFGITDFITKPVSGEKLVGAIQ